MDFATLRIKETMSLAQHREVWNRLWAQVSAPFAKSPYGIDPARPIANTDAAREAHIKQLTATPRPQRDNRPEPTLSGGGEG